MAKCIIDSLKSIQIQKTYAKLLTALFCQLKSFLKLLLKIQAIGQACKCIMECLILKLLIFLTSSRCNFFMGVTSLAIVEAPMILPPGSRTGEITMEIVIIVPSLRTRVVS